MTWVESGEGVVDPPWVFEVEGGVQAAGDPLALLASSWRDQCSFAAGRKVELLKVAVSWVAAVLGGMAAVVVVACQGWYDGLQ